MKKSRNEWFDHMFDHLRKKPNRGVAQLVARCVRDAKVVGSNPVASTKTAAGFCPAAVFLGDGYKRNREIFVGSREERKAKKFIINIKVGERRRFGDSQSPVASTKNP